MCGSYISEHILENVRVATYFFLIADETTDASNSEQLSIVLHFVDENLSVREEFLGFAECKSGVSGNAIATNLVDILKNKWHLNLENLCGQAYDGAGAMARRIRGVAARIMADYPKAVYTYCSSHVLNLCIVNSAKEADIRNMISVNFLFYVNDYIEDMVIFTTLVKIYSIEYVCNTEVSGLGEIYVQRKFLTIRYFHQSVKGVEQLEMQNFCNYSTPRVTSLWRMTSNLMHKIKVTCDYYSTPMLIPYRILLASSVHIALSFACTQVRFICNYESCGFIGQCLNSFFNEH